MAVTDIALQNIFDRFAEGRGNNVPVITLHSFERLASVIPSFLNNEFTLGVAVDIFQSFARSGDVAFPEFTGLLQEIAQARYPDEDSSVAYAHFLAMNVFRIPDISLSSRAGSSSFSPLRSELPDTYSTPVMAPSYGRYQGSAESAYGAGPRYSAGVGAGGGGGYSAGIGYASGQGSASSLGYATATYGQSYNQSSESYARPRLVSPVRAVSSGSGTGMGATSIQRPMPQVGGGLGQGIGSPQEHLTAPPPSLASTLPRRPYSPRPVASGSPGSSFTLTAGATAGSSSEGTPLLQSPSAGSTRGAAAGVGAAAGLAVTLTTRPGAAGGAASVAQQQQHDSGTSAGSYVSSASMSVSDSGIGIGMGGGVAGTPRKGTAAQDMAHAHRLLSALDKIALRQRTKHLMASFVALRESVRRHAELQELQDSAQRDAEEREEQVQAEARAAEQARAVEAAEVQRRAEADRARRAAEETLRREAAQVAAAAAELAAKAAQAAAATEMGRKRMATTVGSLLFFLLVLFGAGWALTLAAFTSAADALGGHCEVVLWWHEYAAMKGLPIPQLAFMPAGAAGVDGGLGAGTDLLGGLAGIGPSAPPLAWHADNGCLYAYGLRTPLCVAPDCLLHTLAGMGGAEDDECGSPYGCGIDSVAV